MTAFSKATKAACFAALSFGSIAGIAQQARAQQASLSGHVLTGERVPVPAAAVLLHCASDARRDAHTISGQDGSYRIPSLSACSYTLAVTAEGFSPSNPVAVNIAAAQQVLRDIVLSRATETTAAERPSFQAAGIHGLIDPGGYSASATAGAAGNVLHDVSGVQRDLAEGRSHVGSVGCAALSQGFRAAQQHPNDWQANAEAGQALLQHGEAGAALPYLLHASALAPVAQAVSVRLDLAEALVLSGDFRQALGRLAQLSPREAGPRYLALRARAEEGLGDFVAAVRHRSEALQQSATPDNTFALAYEHLLAGEVDQANRVLQDGLVRFPQSVSLLVGLGAVQFFQHHIASALEVLLRAARMDSQDRRPYPLLGDISRIPDVDTNGVLHAMERHLAVDPDDAKGNAALGSFLLHHAPTNSSEASQRAQRLLQRALELDPGLTDARSNLALIYHREGSFTLEAEQLARVASAEPSRDVEYRLGLAYRNSGQADLSKLALLRAQNLPDPSQESAERIASLLSVAPVSQTALPCSGIGGF